MNWYQVPVISARRTDINRLISLISAACYWSKMNWYQSPDTCQLILGVCHQCKVNWYQLISVQYELISVAWYRTGIWCLVSVQYELISCPISADISCLLSVQDELISVAWYQLISGACYQCNTNWYQSPDISSYQVLMSWYQSPDIDWYRSEMN